MNKGIVIIATRSPIYGKMAYNLALTIKATGTKVPVALIHDEAAITHLLLNERAVFNQLIKTEMNWNGARFNVDKLSPYDFTLQLDADMLWLKKDPIELFAKYKDAELLVTNEGYFDPNTGEEKLTGGYSWLADRDETIKKYRIKNRMYQMRWEALFFKKTDKVRKMFLKAEEIRNVPKLKVWQFEGQTVDEFCFYVAAAIYGLDQDETPFLPVYWKYGYPPTIAEINNTHWAVSFGGNAVNKHFKSMYDTIMGAVCYKLGLKYKYPLQSKRDYIPERQKV